MALTVTAAAQAGTGLTNGINLRLFVIRGALPRLLQSATPVTQSGAAAHQASLTSAAGSEVFGSLFGTASFTFDAGSTAVDNINDATHTCQYGSFKSVASGTRTVGASAPATNGGMAAFEVAALTAIAEDASAPAVATSTTATTVTSPSFDPPGFTLLVGLVQLLGVTGVSAATVTDTLGLTWTEKAVAHASGAGYAGVWLADMPGLIPGKQLARRAQVRTSMITGLHRAIYR